MYTIRPANEKDISEITKIYNSNMKFIETHLGYLEVDDNFIKAEFEQMKSSGFSSSCIVDFESEKVIGVLDYKIGEVEVYLSLVMIDSYLQGSGLGRSLYSHFESSMKAQKQRVIRIDVVNDYENNLVSFWKTLGFVASEVIELEWGRKMSKALLMKKDI